MRKPDFLIVGAPRSATTSMQIYLRQHPQIFFPRRKEVHFFGSDLVRLARDFWFVEDEQQYLALFRAARADQIAGEASAMYLQSKRAAAEIKLFNPRMKIIIQLRNPIDVLYSHHGHLVWAVNEDIEDFEAALAAEPERQRGLRIPPCAIMLDTLLYRETARFAEQVQRYFDAFGRDNVHVLIYDDLKADPAGAFRRVLEYLGVDPEFEPVFESVNQHKRVRNRFVQKMTMAPPAPLRTLLRACGDDLSYRLRVKIQEINSVAEARPPLPAPCRRRLAEELAPEVERLSALLGRDLTHWVGSGAKAR
jgi:hypothetical protein